MTKKYNIVNHKDGNKLNSFLYNLEFTDTTCNAIHARDNGLLHPQYGENHVCSKITEETCKNICSMIECRQYSQQEIAKLNNTTIIVVESIKEAYI